jgi:hypothetical protein
MTSSSLPSAQLRTGAASLAQMEPRVGASAARWRNAGKRVRAAPDFASAPSGLLDSINVIASEAKQSSFAETKLDCVVASAPRNDAVKSLIQFFKHHVPTDTTSHSRGALRPSFASIFTPQETRGRRESRVRAAPAVSRAMLLGKTHTSIQVQRRQSGLPCAMVLRLITCSPR